MKKHLETGKKRDSRQCRRQLPRIAKQADGPSQAERSWLNDMAPLNVACMSRTFETFKEAKSHIHMIWKRKVHAVDVRVKTHNTIKTHRTHHPTQRYSR